MTSIRRPWPTIAGLIVALLCISLCPVSGAAEPPESSTVFDDVETQAKPSMLLDVFDTESRLAALEKKVAELDKTKVTAAQARAIAKEEIAKVTVALRSASGEVRTQSAPMASNFRGGFDIRPGETLIGYEDPMTGRYVDLTQQRQYQQRHPSYPQPVQYWDAPNMQFAVTEPTPQFPRRVAFQAAPVMQQWFGGGGGCAGGQCGL